ncbi:MAG: pentapeptide repeat-containing protein [Gammaproteobacteria bacterium]|nr:pentapeptide repeat-containing protein [Gammaproteobacteria bacterium]
MQALILAATSSDGPCDGDRGTSGGIQKGAESWNQWREQNPQLAPDLQQAELNGATLGLNGKQPFDLSGCDLTDAKLSNFEFTAALSDLKFFKARLTKVIFHGSLQRVDFRRSRLDKVSFEDVAFAQSPLAGCKAKACHFQRARFEVTEQDKNVPTRN